MRIPTVVPTVTPAVDLTAIRTVIRFAFALVFALPVALGARAASAQHTPEQTSLDMWIMQRYRGAQLLPDTSGRGMPAVTQAGAPRVESARTANRRDTIVALHFDANVWRPVLTAKSSVQLADPTGAISGINGRITARRAFRTPRKAGAADTVKSDWRIGWAYLVAIPSRTANAASSGLNGWALVETPKVAPAVPASVVASPPESPLAIPPRNH